MLFVFNDPAAPHIYTLSLHDALPIFAKIVVGACGLGMLFAVHGLPDRQGLANQRFCLPLAALTVKAGAQVAVTHGDRKSTRLNSSHLGISYAVFCLKKKPHKEPMLQQ